MLDAVPLNLMGLITDAPDPVPPGRLTTWLARTSSRLFAGALALAMAAVALTLYQGQQRRAFAEPTASAMGEVRSSSGKSRKSSSSEIICWVSYEFTPAGGTMQRNWRMWEHGCSVSKGRPIHIQYVIARPEVNRPAGESASLPPLLIWFAAGVVAVIGGIVRVARVNG